MPSRFLFDAVAICHSGRRRWEVVVDTMERRSFLKFTLGLAVITAAGAATAPAEAIPVAPIDPPRSDPEVTTEPRASDQEDLDTLKAEPVRWRWRRRRRRRWWYWRRR